MLARNTASLANSEWVLRGQVIHGDKVGRTLGFPTANMVVLGSRRPRYGIYASIITLEDGRRLGAATNFGVRPTFCPPKELLETFIFEFDEDIYGQFVEVELVRFLRPEEKFDGLDSLVEQMERDCVAACAVLSNAIGDNLPIRQATGRNAPNVRGSPSN